MSLRFLSIRCCVNITIGVLGFVILSSAVASKGEDSSSSAGKKWSSSRFNRTQVVQFIEHYRETLNRADPTKIRALYRDDGSFVWITDGVVRYPTVDSLIDAFRKSLKSGIRFETTFAEVSVLPHESELASAYLSFETEGTMKGDSAFKFSGAISMILKRNEHGSWQVWQGHTSTPGGPPSQRTDLPNGD